MQVKVKLIESDILTGEARIFHRFFDADNFSVIQSADHSLAHLSIYNDKELVAYFPAGNWCGAEIIKENK
jgi:hypothetical protein